MSSLPSEINNILPENNMFSNKETVGSVIFSFLSIIFCIVFIIILSIYEAYLKNKNDEKINKHPLLCCTFARYFFIVVFMILGTIISVFTFVPACFSWYKKRYGIYDDVEEEEE